MSSDEKPNMLTGISDVPMASIIFSRKCIRDGTSAVGEGSTAISLVHQVLRE
ncbi:MAG: hypothetical protein WBZ36_00145 [Candidatus Nitrosopolaris sp.]